MAALARITQPTLTRSESRFLAKLSAMTRQSDPLRFLWQVINSRPIVEGSEPALWSIPSATKEGASHTVDIDARVCSCEGFHFKYRCPHLSVADFAARLRFKFNRRSDNA